MSQLGSFFTGYAMLALLWWKPIWTMASHKTAEDLLGFFVIVMMLFFGVFMVIGDYGRFRFASFVGPFAGGCVLSWGVWQSNMVAMLAGFMLLGVTWMVLRRG